MRSTSSTRGLLLTSALAAVVVAASACSKTEDDPPAVDHDMERADSGVPGETRCTGSLEGDLTGTFDCTAATLYSGTEMKSTVSLDTLSPPTGAKSLIVAMTVSGRIEARAYAAADFTLATGGVLLSDDTSYQVNSLLELGEASLDLDATKLIFSGSGSEIYEVHGSAVIVMHRLSDRGGDITLRFTF